MNSEQQYTACVAGLKEFVEGIGGHGVVLGLSGPPNIPWSTPRSLPATWVFVPSA